MAKAQGATAEAARQLRDRIIEFRRVPSNELLDNDRNWRVHPYAQTRAMQEILDTVGIAGAVTAYHSERNGGRLTLIDGHERSRNHEAEWPTLILDVTDEEADLLLLTMDPLGDLAEQNDAALLSLLDSTVAGSPGLENLLHELWF